MDGSVIWRIVGGALNVGIVLLIAPLCQGVLRKVTARVQSRKGPPLLQPSFDLLKLLGKEDIESGETPAMQRFAAISRWLPCSRWHAWCRWALLPQ